MTRKHFIMSVCFIMTALFIIPYAWAGNRFKETIKIETKEIKKRRKAPPKFKLVTFSHQKHSKGYQISCGDCHHDKDHNPMNLKIGDEVQQCIKCHTKTQKDKKNRKDIMVLENAMHENCIGCHKEINKKAGDPKGRKGPGPTSCSKCHVSTKK